MSLVLHRHVLDLEAGTCRGEPRLTPLELRFLLRLARSVGEVVPRDTILKDVWNYHPDSRTRAVGAMVRRLRRKIEPDPNAPTFLLVVRGLGWKLNVPSGGSAVAPQSSDGLASLFPSWDEDVRREVERQLDPDGAGFSAAVEVLRRHGPDGVRLLRSIERARVSERLDCRPKEHRSLLKRLAVFEREFCLIAARTLLGVSEQACVEFLDVAIAAGDVLPTDRGYRMRPSVWRFLRPELTAADWAAFDEWLLRPDLIWRFGEDFVARHAVDVIRASERRPGGEQRRALFLMLLDVADTDPRLVSDVARVLEDAPSEVRVLASKLNGAPESFPLEIREKARRGDLLSAFVCVRLDDHPEIGLSCMEEATGPAWLELRLLEGLAFLPSFSTRAERIRAEARKRGWKYGSRELIRATVLHHLVHFRFERALSEGARQFPGLHGIALFGVGADDEARTCAEEHPDNVLLGLILATLDIQNDPVACRRVLGALSIHPGARQSLDLRRLILDHLDGVESTPTTRAFSIALTESDLPHPAYRSPALIIWFIAARRGWLPRGRRAAPMA